MTRTSHRRLRVGALATASAVLLGLATAVAPAAVAADTLEAVNVQEYTDSSGIRHIFGEIVNNGSTPVAARADVFLLDASGTQVGSEPGTPFVDVIAPNGGRSPFEAQPSDTYDHAQVSVSVVDPTPAFNHAFTITKKSEVVDPGTGARMINAAVRNDNTTEAADVSVVFTFYNATGGVVGAEAIPVGALAAGASTDFSEPVDPALPGVASWTAIAQSPTAPSGDGTGNPPATGTPGDPATTLNCNPVMTLSTKTVNVGRTTRVSVANATPGSKLTLEGYSRPSTEYAPIRSEVAVAQDGTISPFDVRPPTSARVRLQVSGCSTPGTGQVISVIPGLGITVTRVGTRTYRFSGKIIPGKQNLGRAISLYVASGTGAFAKKASVKSAVDGAYGVNVLLPKGAVKVYWATGADMTNLAGKSAVKAFTTS